MIAKALLALALSCFVGVLPAAARTFCTAPVDPICVVSPETFQRELAKDRCEQDVEDWAEEMEAYIGCLETKVEEADRSANRIQRIFECRKSGHDDCT